VGDVIVEYLSEHKADLLVMGSHGRGAFKAVLLGSVATRVTARCKLPMLIVRPRARRPPEEPKERGLAVPHHRHPSPGSST
jgi:hypothetical protein